jgi:transglutaminase-like putative cysteine protease
VELPSTEGRRPVLVSVQSVRASRTVIYAPGEPLSIDRPYRAILRGPDDLVALAPARSASEYQVLSYVPEQDAARLAAAGTSYPAEVSARHLQLPANLDPRLAAVARQITAGAATPYDQAIAIERELRKIPYSLDLPTPPAGRELVSWFIFDLKKGYCDYYASAMVVLARLNGIPARLAIGYATGDFDAKSGQYVVTELSAHSWPELYFPGMGWIPFEPTAYQPAPPRIEAESTPAPELPLTARGPEDLATGLAEIQASAQQNAVVERRETAARVGYAGVLGLALIWAVWLFRANAQPVPSSDAPALRAYERFAWWGRRLGRPRAAGETLREYAFAVSAAAARIGARGARPDAARLMETQAVALANDVAQALYAPEEQAQPVAARPLLWRALRSVWLARMFGGGRTKAGETGGQQPG